MQQQQQKREGKNIQKSTMIYWMWGGKIFSKDWGWEVLL